MRSASFVLTVLVVVLGVAQVADAFGAGTLPLSSSRKMVSRSRVLLKNSWQMVVR